MAKEHESGEWTVAPSDESDRRDVPFHLETIAGFLGAPENAPFSDEDFAEVADAWRCISGMIANKHPGLVADAAWFLRVLLLRDQQQAWEEDREESAAAKVATPALQSLS